MTVGANPEDYAAARYVLADEDNVRVVEMTSDDAWIRDCGPTFVVNDEGGVRAVHWHFNSWGGLVDGLYFPWDQDALVGVKVADLAARGPLPSRRVRAGGRLHPRGRRGHRHDHGDVPSVRGPQPRRFRARTSRATCSEYLNVEKVIWVKDGIDPDETNGHIDDVACFVRPGEVACIWTDDESNPFYDWPPRPPTRRCRTPPTPRAAS